MNYQQKITSLARNAAWRFGEDIVKRSKKNNVVTVCEYPKSGGTWLAKNIATALNLPFIGNGVFIPILPCVIRTHWNADTQLAPAVLVVRDVRDIMVSLFHHRLRNIANTPKRKQQYDEAFGESLQLKKIKEQLPEFMKIEFDNPRYGSKANWSEHTRKVLSVSKNKEAQTSLIKYEDALNNANSELDRVLKEIGKPVDAKIIDLSAQLHDSKWGNTRSQHLGETTFLRTAAAGDWRAHFNYQSANFIYERCQDELLALGYVQSDDWWKDF